MNVAQLPILADRYGALVRQIYLRGLDLTGVAMRAQVRLGGDVPGPPLVDLQTVANGNAEGLRLVSVTSEAGVPVSHVEMVINETTMEGLPYTGEIGSATALAWDWQLTLSGRKQRIAKGEFVITGDGVTGADNAPSNRPSAWSTSLSPIAGMQTGATLTFGDEIITITVDGANLVAPLAEAAEAARIRAEQARTGADLAAATALAASRYFPSRVAGEAASAADQLFSTDDGGGVLVYYRRTVGGSTEIGRALTPARLAAADGAALIAFAPAGDGAVIRDVRTKLREVIVTLTDYGAVMNVDNAAAAAANDLAIQRAFAASLKVWATGNRTDFYVFGQSPQIPDDGILMGDGATFRLRGEGMRMGQRSKSRWVSYVGILPPVAVGTPGSGVPPRQSPTPDSPQYALLYMNGKSGCEALIPYLANAPINGVQANNGAFNTIVVERAEQFGHDGIFAPTEGAAVYAPGLTDSLIELCDCGQTYGLGAVILDASGRTTIRGHIHDSRRGGVHSSNVPIAGLVLDRMRFRRMGGIAPTISNPPWNHNQTSCAAFIPFAQKPEDVQIINADVEDWGENIFEGTMSVKGLRAKINFGYDKNFKPPNPGALYGNMQVEGGTIDGYRGFGYHTGGSAGAGVIDVSVDAVTFSNPRPTLSRPKPDGSSDPILAPQFVFIQVDGSGNVADNVVVQNNIGYDSTGNVTTGYTIAATGGANFTSKCYITNNKSSVNNQNISAMVRQFGNSWQYQPKVAAPTGGATIDAESRTAIVNLTSALIAAGLMAPT